MNVLADRQAQLIEVIANRLFLLTDPNECRRDSRSRLEPWTIFSLKTNIGPRVHVRGFVPGPVRLDGWTAISRHLAETL